MPSGLRVYCRSSINPLVPRSGTEAKARITWLNTRLQDITLVKHLIVTTANFRVARERTNTTRPQTARYHELSMLQLFYNSLWNRRVLDKMYAPPMWMAFLLSLFKNLICKRFNRCGYRCELCGHPWHPRSDTFRHACKVSSYSVIFLQTCMLF